MRKQRKHPCTVSCTNSMSWCHDLFRSHSCSHPRMNHHRRRSFSSFSSFFFCSDCCCFFSCCFDFSIWIFFVSFLFSH